MLFRNIQLSKREISTTCRLIASSKHELTHKEEEKIERQFDSYRLKRFFNF